MWFLQVRHPSAGAVMALQRTKSLRRVSSIAKSAVYLVRAQNVPAEIGHCLQLVQVVHQDAQYLAELRDENSERLESSPRELARIDRIIETLSLSLSDIDGLMDKYKYSDDVKANASILWVNSDAESFKIRLANLQTQHATLLSEISHLKMMSLVNLSINGADRHFENVHLLNSLVGGGKASRSSTSRPLRSCRNHCVLISDSF